MLSRVRIILLSANSLNEIPKNSFVSSANLSAKTESSSFDLSYTSAQFDVTSHPYAAVLGLSTGCSSFLEEKSNGS